MKIMALCCFLPVLYSCHLGFFLRSYTRCHILWLFSTVLYSLVKRRAEGYCFSLRRLTVWDIEETSEETRCSKSLDVRQTRWCLGKSKIDRYILTEFASLILFDSTFFSCIIISI